MGRSIANVLSSLLAALVASVVVLAVSFALADPAWRHAVWNSGWIVVPTALAVAVLSYMPSAMLLQRSCRFTLRSSALLGLGLGAAVVLFVAAVNTSFSGLRNLFLLLPGAGGLAGVFYYLAFRSLRPNNSSKPTPLRGAA